MLLLVATDLSYLYVHSQAIWTSIGQSIVICYHNRVVDITFDVVFFIVDNVLLKAGCVMLIFISFKLYFDYFIY